MKKKVCKQCRLFLEEGNVCKNCKGNQFTLNWQGRISILDAEHSQVAKQLNVNYAGEYAVKAR